LAGARRFLRHRQQARATGGVIDRAVEDGVAAVALLAHVVPVRAVDHDLVLELRGKLNCSRRRKASCAWNPAAKVDRVSAHDQVRRTLYFIPYLNCSVSAATVVPVIALPLHAEVQGVLPLDGATAVS
jgi:hypothetical protein